MCRGAKILRPGPHAFEQPLVLGLGTCPRRARWLVVAPKPSYAQRMVARVLAILVAVGMVAGALVARSRLDESDERTSTTLRLVCATELEAVCEALAENKDRNVETTVEPAATTADTLTKLAPGKRPPLDGWLVTAPWPAIVEDARERQATGSLLTAGPVLGRSPVVLAVRAERNPVLAAHCGGKPGWKCLGEAAGKPWSDLPNGRAEWQRVKPGHPPASTAAGLTVLGGAAVEFFDGRTDLSSSDLMEDSFQDWLDAIERAVPDRPRSPFSTMLLRPTFDAVGALEAEAGPLVQAAGGTKPVLIYPSPVVTADVVLAATGGRASGLLVDLVSSDRGLRALARSGWRVDGEKLISGIPTMTLPPTSNLPEPGVLEALRTRVEQASR